MTEENKNTEKQCDIHVVSKSFYCIDEKDRLIKCKKQCMHCARLETI
jgi:predicted nicotinamide N-methyase